MKGIILKRKLLLIFIIFILIVCIAGCSSSSANQASTGTIDKEATQTSTDNSLTQTNLPAPELKSVEIEGSDGSKSYKLENNIINGNINAMSVKMKILNLADNKVEVIWSAEGKEIIRNGAVDHMSGDYYLTGVNLSGGLIQSGNYSCEILINNNSVKTVNFEVKQLN